MKRLLYIGLLCCIGVTVVSCDKKAEGVFTDDTTEEYQLYDYYIDEYGNEGIVAYIYTLTTLKKYIIVLSVDEAYESWGPMGEIVYKDTVSKSGIEDPSFGVAMHQAMTSIGIERFPAQAWCNQKNADEPHPRGGSWRLPSYYEYKQIFGTDGNKVPNLNKALSGVNGTLISSDQQYWTCVEDITDYWSFSESDNDYDQANRAVTILPNLKAYTLKDRWLKNIKHNVRAIKYVYYQYN